MLDPAIHARRRKLLSAHLGGKPVVLLGNGPFQRNLPMTQFPFRQDSTVLYLSGCQRPHAALLIEDGGYSTLFLVPPRDDDALWHGASWTLEGARIALAFDAVLPLSQLEQRCARHAGQLLSMAVSDPLATARAQDLCGEDLRFGDPQRAGSAALVDAVITQRRRLEPVEADEIRTTARVTAAAHIAAMRATRPGVPERHLAALFDGVLRAAGTQPAYGSIVTVHGEILHNDRTDDICKDGQLLLLDGGAEAASGYATDVTRTWPVSKRFSPRQRAAYDAVLAAQQAAIEQVRPGVRYRSVHDAASLVIARFLVDEGLLRGLPEDLVDRGAHALFFPHGVGHLIGLDVHDMEAFGDRVTYPPDRRRSEQFGTAYLRLDLDLEPGMCVTIEPGFYVVPAILQDPVLAERFGDALDRERAMSWVGFGGIRIEDDLLCTPQGSEILTAAVPKSPDAIEDLVGTAPDLLGACLDGVSSAS
ncbi:MAG: aminopeptidase P family protein [Oligoflexia bacterium]|nr:aminopeptidase P family protein [Oligoflexia bacterium]